MATSGDPSSQDLAPAQGNFSQQGSLDWVALSGSSVRFTVDVLGRFMAAGVQPFTIMVGQEVARNVALAESGQRNMQDALNRLASYRGLGDVLWFGFGIRSLARTLGATVEGRSLLALCAALGECFHEDFAASVLHHMVLAYNPPSGFVPSLNEWQKLVKACTGILAQTKFPILVDSFMRLVPSRRRLQEALESCRCGYLLEKECPLPNDVATTLLALGMLVQNKYTSITIDGGVGASWIAAMGEWMYNLKITITDSEDKVIYETTAAVPRPQLLVRLGGKAGGSMAAPSKALTLASKTFHLRDKLGIMKVLSIQDSPLYGGRLSWHECLREVYGYGFSELMRVPNITGAAFGCAARIFSGIIGFEKPGVDRYQAVQHKNYFTESGGRGFIRHSAALFPELKPIAQISYDQLALSFKDAQVTYIRALFDIRRNCNCDICTGSGLRTSPDSICLLPVFESIVIICQILSGIVLADNLGVRRCGLEWIYCSAHNAVVKSSRRVGTPGQELIRRTEIARILEPTQGQLLEDAMMLFTGRKMRTGNRFSSFSFGGVCSYYSILQDFTLDREVLGRVTVVPGHIESDGMTYHHLEDRTAEPDAINSNHPGWYRGVSIALTQQIRSLQIDLVFTDETSSGHESPKVGPSYLIDTVLRARGAAHCAQLLSRCRDPSFTIDLYPSSAALLPGCLVVKVKRKPNTVSSSPPVVPEKSKHLPLVGNDPSLDEASGLKIPPTCSTDASKAAALVIARHHNCYAILSDYQCDLCCVRLIFDTDGSTAESLLIVPYHQA